MPQKTVREMNRLERSHYSLGAKIFRTAIMVGIILGLVLLVIGLGLYSVALSRQYIGQAFHVSQNAALTTRYGTEAIRLADSVMERYRAQTPEELAEIGTDAYRARFAEEAADPEYERLLKLFADYSDNESVSDVYLAMYDEATCAMVYIVDPDPGDRLLPGEWESVTEKGMRKFLDWDGEGMLYDVDRTEKYGWMCTAGTPVRNEAGEIRLFVLADVTVANILAGMRAYALQIVVALLLVIALLVFAVLRHMRKTLIQPINAIADAAQNYVRDRRAGLRDSEHFARLNIRTGDEVENLSLIMADMERDLTDYEDNLTRITAEKERIGTELSLAQRIQSAMLPSVFPPYPDRSEFDVFASMTPAREVGGDFYDFFLVDDDHLCLVMADVSGKGIPAALFMMASKIILANNAMMGKSPARILTDTNASICASNRVEMFVTVWLGILELSTGKLTAANAGHEYPALLRAGSGFTLYKDRHGFVIGGTEGVQYREYELQLKPGDKLFVYTDGVPEATAADNGMFGTERMLAALNTEPDAPPEQLLRNVRRAVDDFVREAEQFDDLTMLCLEYKGKAAE